MLTFSVSDKRTNCMIKNAALTWPRLAANWIWLGHSLRHCHRAQTMGPPQVCSFGEQQRELIDRICFIINKYFSILPDRMCFIINTMRILLVSISISYATKLSQVESHASVMALTLKCRVCETTWSRVQFPIKAESWPGFLGWASLNLVTGKCHGKDKVANIILTTSLNNYWLCYNNVASTTGVLHHPRTDFAIIIRSLACIIVI